MSVDDFHDTCDKSVPIYILPSLECFARHLRILLHNYVYRRRFRPYRSELGCFRFLCKVIEPWDPGLPETDGRHPPVDALINSAICANAQAVGRKYSEPAAATPRPSHIPTVPFVDKCKLHVIQSLFRALLVVINAKDYGKEDSRTIGSLPIFLIRTRVEDGLSAPITFETIREKVDPIQNQEEKEERVVKTILETAVDFVMELEARETAACGLRPDPMAVALANHRLMASWRSICGDEPLVGPDIIFVGDENAAKWDGVDPGRARFLPYGGLRAQDIRREGTDLEFAAPHV